jgi:1,4-alpha-glucan branching enzyme
MTCLFRLRAGRATHISLIGDFNKWSTISTPMERVADRWEAFVELSPGVHDYAYFAIEEEEGETLRTEILCPRSKLVVPRSPDSAKGALAAN